MTAEIARRGLVRVLVSVVVLTAIAVIGATASADHPGDRDEVTLGGHDLLSTTTDDFASAPEYYGAQHATVSFVQGTTSHSWLNIKRVQGRGLKRCSDSSTVHQLWIDTKNADGSTSPAWFYTIGGTGPLCGFFTVTCLQATSIHWYEQYSSPSFYHVVSTARGWNTGSNQGHIWPCP